MSALQGYLEAQAESMWWVVLEEPTEQMGDW